MIIQGLLNFISELIAALVDTFNFDSPTIDDMGAGFLQLLENIGTHLGIMDPIVPVAAVVTAVTQVAAVLLVVLAIWLARFVISVFTGGGGSV